jgi:nicotinamidase-related amidase
VATPGGLALIPRLNRLTARARAAGMPVIFTQEMHRADRSDFGIELEFEPPHCLEGTPGMDLAGELDVVTGDHRILNKRRYDAFLGPTSTRSCAACASTACWWPGSAPTSV